MEKNTKKKSSNKPKRESQDEDPSSSHSHSYSLDSTIRFPFLKKEESFGGKI